MAYEESNVLNGEDAAVVEIDGKWYLDFEGWDDGSEENYDDEEEEVD